MLILENILERDIFIFVEDVQEESFQKGVRTLKFVKKEEAMSEYLKGIKVSRWTERIIDFPLQGLRFAMAKEIDFEDAEDLILFGCTIKFEGEYSDAILDNLINIYVTDYILTQFPLRLAYSSRGEGFHRFQVPTSGVKKKNVRVTLNISEGVNLKDWQGLVIHVMLYFYHQKPFGD